ARRARGQLHGRRKHQGAEDRRCRGRAVPRFGRYGIAETECVRGAAKEVARQSCKAAQTGASVPHGGIMSTPGLRETRGYKNYIDGQWIASSTGKTFENRNPADNDDLIGTFQESNSDDLNAAVDAADRAFH